MRSERRVGRARQLRRAMTLPEVKLWTVLRTRPSGLKFRRQHPVGPYILDFYCPATRVAIEVDGAMHATGTQPQLDKARDAWLAAQAIKTIRLPAKDVLDQIEDVTRLILEECRTRSLPDR